MRDEVDPDVYRHVDEIRSLTPHRGITEVIKRAGARDAESRASDWAWDLVGGGYLLSIWCEGVQVHTGTGRWFYIDTLDTERRRSGVALGPLQAPRAAFRIKCLKQIHQTGVSFSAVLQVNRIPAWQLAQGKDSEVDFRVRDDQPWHVAVCDETQGLLVLVRGEPGWVPSSADVEGVPDSESGADDGERVRIVFPDQDHRDKVEAAAVQVATREYERRGLRVENVGRENRGYDLEVFDKAGRAVYHVEVKGTASAVEGFFLTRNERRCSAALATWQLVIVTSALTEPQLEIYSARGMEDTFGFEPLVWRCDPK